MTEPTHDLDSKLMKCIRCGFCLDACPTFRLTGQETRSPRGRIYLVRSWRDSVIPFDQGVIDALDTCLGCRACETACPSGVEYGSILETARANIEEKRMRPPGQRFARRQLLATLTNPGRLRLSLELGGLLRPLTGGKMPALAAKLLSGDADAQIAMPSLPARRTLRSVPEFSPAQGARRAVVGVLEGCVMRVLFGAVNQSTVRVLQANGCDVVAPRAAGCCGALHLHSGYQKDALAKARSLVRAFEPEMHRLDAIVVNSAGCGSTMREYGELLAGDPEIAVAAQEFSSRVRDISEFLDELGLVPPTGPLDATVTYHDACHLAHGQKVREQPRRLLQQIPGLRLVEMEESDTCCGSAGTYNITEPEMAARLLERKVANLRASGASIVAAGNPGCLAWIAQGVAQNGGPEVRVCHPVELLDEAYRGQSLLK